jgi:hypothetical protein
MKLSRSMMGGLLVIAAAASASAQSTTQTVTLEIDAINEIAVAGTPSLTISAAVAGGAPSSATAAGNTWSVTTNQSNAKLTASIGSALPSGVTLSADLGAPAGATSAGLTALSTTAVDLVTGISKLNSAGLSLSYQLDATAAAGTLASTTTVVTYTVTGGA